MTPLVPAFVTACPLAASAAPPWNWGYVAAALTVWAVTQIITGAIVAWVTLKLLQRQTHDVARAVARLTETVASHEQRLGELRLEASERFATKGDFAQLMRISNESDRRIFTKLDDVQKDVSEKVGRTHQRIDELAAGVHEMRGAAAAGKQ